MAERIAPFSVVRGLASACGRLERNPYFAQLFSRWRRLFWPFVLLYLAVTIAQFFYSDSLFSSFHRAFGPSWRYALQAVLLQQHNGLLVVVGGVVPLIVTCNLVLERQRNRLAWVQLTPILPEDIVVGIVGRTLFPVLLLFLFGLPLLLACLLLHLATLPYTLAMLSKIIVAALLFPMLGFLIGIFCGRSLLLGVTLPLLIFGGSIGHLEYGSWRDTGLVNLILRSDYANVNPLLIGMDSGIRTFSIGQELDARIAMNLSESEVILDEEFHRELKSNPDRFAAVGLTVRLNDNADTIIESRSFDYRMDHFITSKLWRSDRPPYSLVFRGIGLHEADAITRRSPKRLEAVMRTEVIDRIIENDWYTLKTHIGNVLTIEILELSRKTRSSKASPLHTSYTRKVGTLSELREKLKTQVQAALQEINGRPMPLSSMDASLGFYFFTTEVGWARFVLIQLFKLLVCFIAATVCLRRVFDEELVLPGWAFAAFGLWLFIIECFLAVENAIVRPIYKTDDILGLMAFFIYLLIIGQVYLRPRQQSRWGAINVILQWLLILAYSEIQSVADQAGAGLYFWTLAVLSLSILIYEQVHDLVFRRLGILSIAISLPVSMLTSLIVFSQFNSTTWIRRWEFVAGLSTAILLFYLARLYLRALRPALVHLDKERSRG